MTFFKVVWITLKQQFVLSIYQIIVSHLIGSTGYFLNIDKGEICFFFKSKSQEGIFSQSLAWNTIFRLYMKDQLNTEFNHGMGQHYIMWCKFICSSTYQYPLQVNFSSKHSPVPDVFSLIVISDLLPSGIVIHAAQIVNQTLSKLCPCRKVVKPAFRRLFYRSDNFPSNDSYYINTVDQIIIRLSLTFYSVNYRVRNAQFWIIDKIQSAKLIWNQLFSWAIAFGSNEVPH